MKNCRAVVVVFLKITSSYFSNKSQWAIIVFFDFDKWIKSIFSTCSTIKGTALRRNTICTLVARTLWALYKNNFIIDDHSIDCVK